MIKGRVYLIQRQGTDDYKIGYTRAKDATARLKSLQVGSADPLEIIYEVPSEYCNMVETALHNRFRHRRKEGEWFELETSEVLQFESLCETYEKNLRYLSECNSYFRDRHKNSR